MGFGLVAISGIMCLAILVIACRVLKLVATISNQSRTKTTIAVCNEPEAAWRYIQDLEPGEIARVDPLFYDYQSQNTYFTYQVGAFQGVIR
jgi:cell division protein FtsN